MIRNSAGEKKLAHVDQRDADQRGSARSRKSDEGKPQMDFPTFFSAILLDRAVGTIPHVGPRTGILAAIRTILADLTKTTVS